MRRVHVEEAAAVGPELLDRDLRRGRPYRDDLLGQLGLLGRGLPLRVEHGLAVLVDDRLVVLARLHDGRRGVRLERLHDTLRDEDQRRDEGGWQEDVESGPIWV